MEDALVQSSQEEEGESINSIRESSSYQEILGNQSESGKKCEACFCTLWEKFVRLVHQLVGLSIRHKNTPYKTVWLCTGIAWLLTTAALPSNTILIALFALSSISLFVHP